MFTEQQKAALEAPLNRSHVKARKQGKKNVSYIEGWHAIAEANRVFGFDGWTRETIDIRCVSERERAIGDSNRSGWGVSYIARVKVTVFAGDTMVTREGIGSGHGIDMDIGQAHEKASKESETDAMKRALMTFGNQFGLALYDATQANVIEDRTHEQREEIIEQWGERRGQQLGQSMIRRAQELADPTRVVWDAEGERPARDADYEDTMAVLKAAYIHEVREFIRKATDAKELHEWWNSETCKKARRDFNLGERELGDLMQFCTARIAVLKAAAAPALKVVGTIS